MWAPRFATAVAIASAAALATFGIVRGTWAAGGSDSSCYALMATAFAHGELQPFIPLALEAPWPDAARAFAPAGFIPSQVRAGAASPVCAPGFSLILAIFHQVAGPQAIFIVSALGGALLVWLSFILCRRLSGPLPGAAAAVIVATIPVVLFQVTQPMNDVLVSALWMGVIVAAASDEPSRSWLLGAITGLAILVRPNLAPAAAIVGLWVVIRAWADARATRAVQRSATAFALAAAPSMALLLTLNDALYGHSLQSGYGSARDLFSLQNVPTNLRHYGSAVVQTELGLPLLGFVAPAVVSKNLRPVAWLVVSVATAIVVVYLLYQPFAEWWYLRFLLPALAPLTVLAVAVVARFTSEVRPVAGGLALIAIAAGVAVFGVITARDRQAFELQRLESRFWRSGEIVRTRLPANAVLVTVWHSGTVRFHADRPAVLWDSLDPVVAEKAIGWLSARGLEPYLLLERWEEPLFRERFAAGTDFGNLDWPPRFDIDRQVRIFKPSDRAAYVQGQSIPTEYILPRR
jgi:hypothetical protein